MGKPLTDENIDELLVDELKQFAQSGAGMGWLLSNPLTNSVGIPQAAAGGTEWAAKRLKTHSYSDNLIVSADPQTILDSLQHNFPDKAPLIIESEGKRALVYSSVVGSGNMDLNPTVLIAMYVDGANSIRITAHAKEGLIKQKSSEKAVKRLISQLSD